MWRIVKMEIKLTDEERQPVECWTRVMGSFRPISHFNKGKQAEFSERKWFNESKIKQPFSKLSQINLQPLA